MRTLQRHHRVRIGQTGLIRSLLCLVIAVQCSCEQQQMDPPDVQRSVSDIASTDVDPDSWTSDSKRQLDAASGGDAESDDTWVCAGPCWQGGYCTPNGPNSKNCSFSHAEGCKRWHNCKRHGACSYDATGSGLCYVGSDADCCQSLNCKNFGTCVLKAVRHNNRCVQGSCR